MKDYLHDLAPHFETLVELERSWAVDIKFAEEHVVPMATIQTQNMVLDAMPSESSSKKVDDVVAEIDKIQKSDMCFFADMQRTLGGIKELV